MARRITGLWFIGIAAFLYASSYVGSAILLNIERDIFDFKTQLEMARLHLPIRDFQTFLIFSALSLAIGIFYLAWAELRKEN